MHFATDKDTIRHSGIVDSVSGDCIKVRILQTSACASCKVAGYCNASESKEKIVDVFGDASCGQLRVGDRVVVTASRWIFLNDSYGLSSRYGAQFMVGVIGILLTLAICVKENSASKTKGRGDGVSARNSTPISKSC